MADKVIPLTPRDASTKEAPSRSNTEGSILTWAEMNKWKMPPFQRPLKVNQKVLELAKQLIHDPVITGVITLGQLPNDNAYYLVDGQHRREAAHIATKEGNELIKEFYVDVRTMQFANFAEMAEEATKLQRQLVATRPDDILRAAHENSKALQTISQRCKFVGYHRIRQSPNSPIVSMSVVLRSWNGSSFDQPHSTGKGEEIARSMDNDSTDTDHLISFLNIAYDAWGRDIQYRQLWSSLNLCLCMWLWRKVVLDHDRSGKRAIAMSRDQFLKCMMRLSAGDKYINWLYGRNTNDRSACYNYICDAFRLRLREDGYSNPKLPYPSWVTS